MDGSLHSTDREFINRRPRALELFLFNRNVVPELLEFVLIFPLRLAEDEGQLYAVHFAIVLEVGCIWNLPLLYTLKSGIYAGEQPSLIGEVHIYRVYFGTGSVVDTIS